MDENVLTRKFPELRYYILIVLAVRYVINLAQFSALWSKFEAITLILLVGKIYMTQGN